MWRDWSVRSVSCRSNLIKIDVVRFDPPRRAQCMTADTGRVSDMFLRFAREVGHVVIVVAAVVVVVGMYVHVRR